MKLNTTGRTGRSVAVMLTTLVLALPVLCLEAACLSSSDIMVVRILPEEQIAVVRFDRQPLRVIRVGDSPVRGYRVLDIRGDRIVIRFEAGPVPETFIIRLRDGEQYLERVLSVPDRSDKPVSVR